MPPARVRVRERREGERTEYNRIAASNPRFPNRRVGRHNQKVSLEGEDPVAKGARSAMVFGQVQTSPCPASQSTENNAKSRLAKPFFFFCGQILWLLNGGAEISQNPCVRAKSKE